MIYLKNFLFSIIIVLASLSPAVAAEREDLYKRGNEAFDKKEYATALKNLFAFYEINKEALVNHPDIKKGLEEKIQTAESILLTAMAANSNISVGKGKIIIRSDTIGGGFSGTGKEIQEMIKSGTIDLEKISKKNQTLNFE